MADQNGVSTRHQNRHDLILDAAQRRFARDGYGSTGIRAIAADVGISEATIYHYFRSKDEILDAIISRTAEGQLQAYQHQNGESVEEVLRGVGDIFLSVMEVPENRDLIHLMLTESAHNQERAELYLTTIWDQGLAALEVAIARTMPGASEMRVSAMAKMLLASLTCFVVHNEMLASVAGRPLESGLHPDRQAFLDEIIDILLKGGLQLTASPPEPAFPP